MGWGWHESMMLGGAFMWLFWVLVIAGVAWLVATLVASRGRSSGSAATTAADIVKERYARGEIDRSEYEQKLQDLRR
jgi:putative membrane protein